MDEDVAATVFKASQSSMGMDCSAIDMENIMAFTTRMVKLAEYRLQVSDSFQHGL
jgi:nucleolar protein 56